MDRNFIISVLEDAKSFYKDEELKAIEEAISIVQDYSKMEEKKKRIANIISETRKKQHEERCHICGGIKRFGIC